jgi:hypothetical protein
VAGSGFPSSSSSEVVNLRQIRKRERVYTSRGVENWRPPRDHASRSREEVGGGCWLVVLLVVLLVLVLVAVSVSLWCEFVILLQCCCWYI